MRNKPNSVLGPIVQNEPNPEQYAGRTRKMRIAEGIVERKLTDEENGGPVFNRGSKGLAYQGVTDDEGRGHHTIVVGGL